MNDLLEQTYRANQLRLTHLARSSYSTEITEAELRVISDSVRPGPAQEPKNVHKEARLVSGKFIRWLFTDTQARELIYKDGVWVTTTTIDGEVDLDGLQIPSFITFTDCTFTGDIHAIWAKARTIRLVGCQINGNLDFQNASLEGDFILDRSQFTHSITMYGIQIAGDLSMKGATVIGQKPTACEAALCIDVANIKGSVFFQMLVCRGELWMLNTTIGDALVASNGSHTTGANFGSTVTMTGTTIKGGVALTYVTSTGTMDLSHIIVGGDLNLTGAHLNGRPTALDLGGAVVSGNLGLTDFYASGAADLTRATVSEILAVLNAELTELNCTDAKIDRLEWIGIVKPKSTKLTLVRANVKILIDEKESWPSRGDLKVGGFIYEKTWLEVPQRVPGSDKNPVKNGGTSPEDRIKWLKLQSDENQLISQPWLQLAKFVGTSGNVAGSRRVLYEMARLQASTPFSVVWDRVAENSFYILVHFSLFWLFGFFVLWRARRMNIKAMLPRDKDAAQYFLEHNEPPANYVPFSNGLYSLENLLPGVKTGQDDAWIPNPGFRNPRQGWKNWLPWYSYAGLVSVRLLLILLGWLFAGILVAAVSGLFRP